MDHIRGRDNVARTDSMNFWRIGLWLSFALAITHQPSASALTLREDAVVPVECDEALGCDASITDLNRRAGAEPSGPFKVLGVLGRDGNDWMLQDPDVPDSALRILISDALVERAFGPSSSVDDIRPGLGRLIRVLGAHVQSAQAERSPGLIHDYAGIQVLSSRQEADLPLSVDGRGETRCAKIVDLLGDYCLVSVGVVLAERARYHAKRLFLHGYLRCDVSSGLSDFVFASRESAVDGVTSVAIRMGDARRRLSVDAEFSCDLGRDATISVRVAGRFDAADSDATRADSIGLLRDVEAVHPLERDR